MPRSVPTRMVTASQPRVDNADRWTVMIAIRMSIRVRARTAVTVSTTTVTATPMPLMQPVRPGMTTMIVTMRVVMMTTRAVTPGAAGGHPGIETDKSVVS